MRTILDRTPHIVTTPYEQDVDAMAVDVTRARQAADVVVVSIHWGIHHAPRLIAEYQLAIKNRAFAAGAQVIFGHHAHIPKAIESPPDGRVCFYSLGNFLMSTPEPSDERKATLFRDFGASFDSDYPNLPYGRDAKRSLVAKVAVDRHGVVRASVVPVLIDPDLRPRALQGDDPEFDDAVAYLDWASENFPTDLKCPRRRP